ncbi:MAG: hypothetical protein NVSMB65_11910 [Chloroflexota bacterium]
MSISRTYRGAAAALLCLGLLACGVGTNVSAHAASKGKVVASKPVVAAKPIVLVVDTAVKGSGLSIAQALKSAGALLPINVTAPTRLPAGVQLVSVNVQRPVYQITRGSATLIYTTGTAGVTFSLQEGASPFNLLGLTQTPVVIHGAPGTVSDLGSSGISHLIAVTWMLGKHSFAMISNVGKSKLTTAALLQVANSISQ